MTFDGAILFLAQAAPAQPQAAGSPIISIGGMFLIIGVMIFFMYRSNKKEQKRREEMISSVKIGDKVLSIGGLYGIVTNVKEECFVVKIADNVKVELAKGAVSAVTDKDKDKDKGKEEKK